MASSSQASQRVDGCGNYRDIRWPEMFLRRSNLGDRTGSLWAGVLRRRFRDGAPRASSLLAGTARRWYPPVDVAGTPQDGTS